jgi:ketosteroid isomerase-like protein
MMSGAPRRTPTAAAPRATRDEDLIRWTLDHYAAAIHAKDARAAIACLSEDVVAYDLAPPLAFNSAAARDPAGLQKWFDTWEGPIRSAVRDLHVEVGGNVAFAHALQHMTGTKIDGENVDLWFRATAGLIKTTAGWRIAHLHNSVPFAMDGSGKALLHLKP